jgi:hypothetical protein
VLATVAPQPVFIGLIAAVSGHIWAGSESVNAFLQFYFNGTEKARNLRFLEWVFGLGRRISDARTGYPPLWAVV